jgi:hypothetical protein
MESFEGLQNIDNFCKVIVKKTPAEHLRTGSISASLSDNAGLAYCEEPFVDVFDEEDHVRILVQCRCQEQQVTFHPTAEGLVVCRKDFLREKDGSEVCNNVCTKLDLKTDGLQLDNMLFVVAKCNNNNTLEAMIPKLKK